MAAPTCPTCRKTMEGGYLLDHTHSGVAVSNWVEGAPERSAWTGLKIKNRKVLPMYAWRCPNCFEVRLFAPDA